MGLERDPTANVTVTSHGLGTVERPIDLLDDIVWLAVVLGDLKRDVSDEEYRPGDGPGGLPGGDALPGALLDKLGLALGDSPRSRNSAFW